MKRKVLQPILFVWVMAGIAMLSMWHMFASSWMWVVAASGMLLGTLLAWVAVKFRFAWWGTLIALIAAYLAVGFLAVIPTLTKNPSSALDLTQLIVTAPVTGWKNLLTLDLPLGTYQAVLAPVAVLFLFVPCLALLMVWRGGRSESLAPVIMLILPVFALVFGSSADQTQLHLITGIVSFVTAVVWLVWRSNLERRIKLKSIRHAEDAPRFTMHRISGTRFVLGAAMLALAVAAGVVFAPSILAGQTRDVLRTSVHPDVEVEWHVSPLSNFREYRSADWFDDELFSIDAPQSVTEIRLATLSSFDGSTMNMSAEGAAPRSSEFRRVPASLPHGSVDPVTVTITVDKYNDMWVPIAGDLVSLNLSGSNQMALNDAFFYHREGKMGVQLAEDGFPSGTVIEELVIPSTQSDVVGFQPARTKGKIDANLVPETLTAWIDEQQIARDGEGLATLIERLRARGYLSHSVVMDRQTQSWVTALEGYEFVPSRAGHSSDRMNEMFADLLTRSSEVGADARDVELVAAVGDEEQFAVAATLIADTLGFDARVVMGVKLEDDPSSGVVACTDMECRGENVTVWLEVQDAATGEWAQLSVTPQHKVLPSPETTINTDPQNPTDVTSSQVKEIPPPDSNPGEGIEPPAHEESGPGWWATVWPILRVTLIGLLLAVSLAIPFLVIIGAKWYTRRQRKRVTSPRLSVVGAWNEYVDRAVDYGFAVQGTSTRREYARETVTLETESLWLADNADYAAFAGIPLQAEDAEAYWDSVDVAITRLGEDESAWRRIRARLSLRTFKTRLNLQ